jgi:hypothetical protein
VPDSTPDGALVELTVSHVGRERDSLWRRVRGHVRRGQGKDGLDAFEVTGVWHVANANLAKVRPADNKEFATEGWRVMKEKVPLTH